MQGNIARLLMQLVLQNPRQTQPLFRIFSAETRIVQCISFRKAHADQPFVAEFMCYTVAGDVAALAPFEIEVSHCMDYDRLLPQLLTLGC